MERIKLEKYVDESNYKTFYLKRDTNKEFIISFMGNLDLYFNLNEFEDKPYFIIDKSNYILYELFDDLYNDVKNCNIFGKDKVDIPRFLSFDDNNFFSNLYIENNYEEYKNRYEYKKLFNNGIIEWKSDDYPDEIAPYFNIIKDKDCYIIRFTSCILDKKIDWNYPMQFDNWISVRIRNSGSKYDPFNCIFMRLYNSLCNIDEMDLNQIHIEEYLYNEKKKLLLK